MTELRKCKASDVPKWAQSVIVAELHKNDSDLMTDYFNHTTEKTVLLAFSKHNRDLFSEMRKAAALFEPTAHLAPGLDKYKVRLVWDHDSTDQAAKDAAFMDARETYWKGGYIPPSWWREKYGLEAGEDVVTVHTEAEAAKWCAEHGALAGTVWRVDVEKYEHREKYSMGAGYYLKDGSRDHSGWCVKKRPVGKWFQVDGVACRPGLFDSKTPNAKRASVAVDNVTVTENAERDGVELKFPDKPDASTRATLKAVGFRWSRRQGLWYAKRREATLYLAYTLAGGAEAALKRQKEWCEDQERGNIEGMLEAQGII